MPKRAKKASSATNGSSENTSPKPKSIGTTIVLKGKAPVDSLCPLVNKTHVYCEGDDVFDVMLNQTNIERNNNKYYIIQLLEDDSRKTYHVWFRWGRVGNAGQNTLLPVGSDLDKAKKLFSKKFFDKTKNAWDERNEFEKVAGKYDMLHMDYSVNEGKDEPDAKKLKKENSGNTEPIEPQPSKLELSVQELIQLICDINAMEESVIEMKYDTKKAPLGRLTKEQITAGYQALKEIDELISSNKTGSSLLQACNRYYTRIPHYFGMKTPPIIRTHAQMRAELQLLEALGDIEVAINLLKCATEPDLHPIDRQYKSLHCALKPLDKESEDYHLIEKSLQSTHAKTHRGYKMELVDVFECSREGEDEGFSNKGNNVLLWHGSRMTNWAGILSQGLRIAPPEAPTTGYMFGKGIYFADMSSKSANYCFASRNKHFGLLLLSEVSLGNAREVIDADYEADKLPKGKNSVKGLGRVIPNPKKLGALSDGTPLPMGPSISSQVKKEDPYTLNYNEYVVYDPAQVKMRYLLKIKFKF